MVGNAEEREENNKGCDKEQPCKTKLIELKGPGNNILFSLPTKPAHLHWFTFCFTRRLHWQLQGTGPNPQGLAATSRNSKLFFCLQVVSPHCPSKEATAILPSDSTRPIQGLC